MATRPAARLGLDAGTLKPGAPADLVVVELEKPWIVTEANLHSRSRNTAFEGARMTGQVIETWIGGRRVFNLADDQAGA